MLSLKMVGMRKLFNLCISSPEEVMFRSVDDYNEAVNQLALSSFKTNTSILADSIMSTHLHSTAESEDPYVFLHNFKIRYSLYFNKKYNVKRHDNSSNYVIELNGQCHILNAVNYVLRNGLHHGQCASAFGNPSTMFDIFCHSGPTAPSRAPLAHDVRHRVPLLRRREAGQGGGQLGREH